MATQTHVPAIHVVVPTFNRDALLARTIRSLSASSPPSVPVTTWIVENGKRGKAAEIALQAATWLNARYRFCEAGNKSAALNMVLSEIEEGLVTFFDDDVRVVEGVLPSYAAAAAAAPEASFFGGPFGVDYETEPEPCIRRHLPASARGWEPSATALSPVDHVLGFNWAAWRHHIRDVGPFTTDRGPTATGRTPMGQESEMMWRLQRNGIACRFVPSAKVWHYVPADRCDRAWVLERHYRKGMTEALASHTKPPTARLRRLGRWAALEIGFSVRESWRRNSDVKLDMECALNYLAGYAFGRAEQSRRQ